jgi:threonine dehydratase
MTVNRRPIYINTEAKTWTTDGSGNNDAVREFNSQCKGSATSPLVPLPHVAAKLGVKSVFVKDEGSRLNGAHNPGVSWAAYRALTEKLGISGVSSVELVKSQLTANPITLVAASDSTHGLTVARVGSSFGTPVEIYVSAQTSSDVVALLRGEGAKVVITTSELPHDILAEAQASVKATSGILVQEETYYNSAKIPQVSHANFFSPSSPVKS